MLFNQISKSMGLPFTIVYLALIVSALYFTFVTAPRALNSNNWPYVQGEVTHSELIQRKRTTKNGDPVTIYSAKIYYQYAVDGKQYSANEVKWADHNTSERIKQGINERYPSGSKVTIFYDPAHPTNAALEKGLSFGHILTGIFLLVSIGTMAFALYRNARKRKL